MGSSAPLALMFSFLPNTTAPRASAECARVRITGWVSGKHFPEPCSKRSFASSLQNPAQAVLAPGKPAPGIQPGATACSLHCPPPQAFAYHLVPCGLVSPLWGQGPGLLVFASAQHLLWGLAVGGKKCNCWEAVSKSHDPDQGLSSGASWPPCPSGCLQSLLPSENSVSSLSAQDKDTTRGLYSSQSCRAC